MIEKKGIILLFVLMGMAIAGYAQNRNHTYNSIGWYNVFANVSVHEKWSLHGEYQWRRNNIITDWQQGVFKTGIQYNPLKGVAFRFAYAWIETYPYGEIPINAMGKDFTEHRLYEVMQLTNTVARFEISHRFMLEQRWVYRYTEPTLEKEDTSSYVNRMRYMFRVQLPLKDRAVVEKIPYIAVYDELFIGFGEQVQYNIFDQNRVGLVFGYRFNPQFRLEAGVMQQTVQYGRLIDDKITLQHNTGLILNAVFNASVHK